ncbi:helix-turn-helix domain-containing protein [Actinobacillus lignieresii]|uniref:Anaerobic benzoate catabolism transcriptional regulator n=1 Tax=Actinobacillus lignieresii TaxID=720 RepID=A0A380TYB9_ACTLI|nr:helix-turn-helix transcriptional regulator [Actinobacillus lignieresii]SUT93643.1 anaerobic benzoate catabolism transcriptional regulator [Actinobacillus lignieresii]VEB26733.1 anaerobic benzoate catabolism transcriptional regulator [Actinobacillus lignieresii]
METYEKVRTMREINQWSQEEMAEKLGMSTTGYAKIERGKSKINLDKLQQIANIFNINVRELIENDKPWVCVIGDNNYNLSHIYSNENLVLENEKLKLIIQHKDELLKQKEDEIAVLKKLVAVFEAK